MSTETAALLNVLLGTQISESMTSEIRQNVYVPRTISDDGVTLEDVLTEELTKGRSLIIAGSAGGGKTMLIDHLTFRLKNLGYELSEAQLVPDLTAIEGNRANFVSKIVSSGQYILAANEGILRDKEVRESLPGVWETIRKLQSGIVSHEVESSIVVDIAGFDPIENALTNILLKVEIRQAIELYEKDCPQNSAGLPCSRLDSLELLDEKMAKIVTSLVKDAVGPGEITYRELWNFIRDLFFGGSCQESMFSSTWIWRLFYGKSTLAKRMLICHNPNFISMPDLTSFLYRGDWQKIQSKVFAPGYSFIHPGQAPIDIIDREEQLNVLNWLKIQVGLVNRAQGQALPAFQGETSGELEVKVLKNNRIELLTQSMNAYFRREKLKDQKASLELWLDMGTERRSKRSTSLVSLGEYPKRELEITRSQVVANVESRKVNGNRYYLQSRNGNRASIELSSELFEALIQGRPISTARRKYDDIDFAIRRFFLNIYDASYVEDSEIISLFTPGSSEGFIEFSWRASRGMKIERQEV